MTIKLRTYILNSVMLLALCVSGQAYAEVAPDDAQILHLLNRISFGPAPGDIAAVRSIGMSSYIEQQLHPTTLTDPTELTERLSDLPTLRGSIEKLSDEYAPAAGEKKNMSEEEKKAANKKANEIVRELSEAKILRAVLSPAQLQEVMVDFWFNHFNVFAEKGADKIWVGAYERDAIRPYALGRFRDLLGATAHHPAMQFYLDNWLNTDPNSPAARGKKIGINENYARELMELHTLGVNGGYTQQDVTTLAHILTGWGLANGRELSDKAAFFFDGRRHDFGDKTFLGYTIRGSGKEEVEQVLDMLAKNPSTAKHIAYELAQYFVADNPPQTLVEKLTRKFLYSDGNITAVLRELFTSSEFWDPEYTQQKFKPPFRYVVSALRASGIVPNADTQLVQGVLKDMGEPLYRCLTPNGYSASNDQWLNSDALLKRIDFSKGLGRFLTNADYSQTIMGSMGQNWSKNTLDTVQQAEPKMRPVLLLGSPEFVNY